jgi:hypothetical protein
MTDTAKSGQRVSEPVKKIIATTSVELAIRESAATISIFRLNRSAHTPAKGETNNEGRNPQMIDRVSIIPDFVSNVIYQEIAYWTREDPNMDTA